MLYAIPGQPDSKVSFKSRYQNFIDGQWTSPVKGQYFENVSPVTGQVFCEVPRSTAEDIERALDAAHTAAEAWGRTSVAARANLLNKIADRMEANLEMLAVAETWDNGKPIRKPWRRIYPGHRPLSLFRRLYPRPGRHPGRT